MKKRTIPLRSSPSKTPRANQTSTETCTTNSAPESHRQRNMSTWSRWERQALDTLHMQERDKKTSFTNLETHGDGSGYLACDTCSSGVPKEIVPAGIVPIGNILVGNNLGVQTRTKGEPKAEGWRPGAEAPNWGVPPKTAHCVPPKQPFFGPKRPRNLVKTPKQRQTVQTLHVRLNCPVTRSPFLPSSSMIHPRNGPKMAKNGRNVRCLWQNGRKPRVGRILGYVAQNPIPRAPSPSANPHPFVVSKPQNGPTRHVDPRISGHLVHREGSPARVQLGPTVGPPASPRQKK